MTRRSHSPYGSLCDACGHLMSNHTGLNTFGCRHCDCVIGDGAPSSPLWYREDYEAYMAQPDTPPNIWDDDESAPVAALVVPLETP